MLRVREHVDRLHGHHLVGLVKQLKVTGLGGGIAADIHDFPGTDFQQLFDDAFSHACTRRVGDDEIRTAVGFDEIVSEDLGHVACVERAILYAIDFGIHLGILNGFLNILNANDFLHETREILCNGSRARQGNTALLYTE